MVKRFLAAVVIACMLVGCGRPSFDADELDGVYVLDGMDNVVDLLVVSDSARSYTRMFWEEYAGKQVYSGSCSLLTWEDECRLDFRSFGRLYQEEFHQVPGWWPALLQRFPCAGRDGRALQAAQGWKA